MHVLVGDLDDPLGQLLQQLGGLVALQLGPLLELVLDEELQVLLDLRGLGLVALGRQGGAEVLAEAAQVVAHRGLDRRGLVLDQLQVLPQVGLGAVEPGLDVGHALGQLLQAQVEALALDPQVGADVADGAGPVGDGVVQQHPPALIGEVGAQELEEGRHAALLLVPLQKAPRADGEDHRVLHQLGQVLVGEGRSLLELRRVEQILLAQHEDQLVPGAPHQPLLNERALGALEHLGAVEQEEHRVGARDVAVGDLGPRLVDVVDPRRVHQRDLVAQDLRRVAQLDVADPLGARAFQRDVVGQLLRVDLLGAAVAQHRPGAGLLAEDDVVDGGGGGGDPHRQQRLPQQRVDEGALAVVELAQHDQVEAVLGQLGQPHAGDVCLQRAHPHVPGKLGQGSQPRADALLVLTISLEHWITPCPGWRYPRRPASSSCDATQRPAA